MKSSRVRGFSAIANRVEFALLVFLFGLMGLVLLLQILFRYWDVGVSLPWSEELARYLQVMLTFLSIGFCLRHGALVRVHTLRDKLSPFAAVLVDLISKVLLWISMLALLPAGFRYVVYQWRVPANTMPIPMGLFYLVLPFSLCVSLLYYSVFLIVDCKACLVALRKRKGEV